MEIGLVVLFWLIKVVVAVVCAYWWTAAATSLYIGQRFQEEMQDGLAERAKKFGYRYCYGGAALSLLLVLMDQKILTWFINW